MKGKNNNKRKRSNSANQKKDSSNDPDKYVAFKLKKKSIEKKGKTKQSSSSTKNKSTIISSKKSSLGVVGKPVLYQKPEMDVQIIDGAEIRTPKNYNRSKMAEEPSKGSINVGMPTKSNPAIVNNIGQPLIIDAHLKKSTKSYYPSFFSTPVQFLESDLYSTKGGLEYQALQKISNVLTFNMPDSDKQTNNKSHSNGHSTEDELIDFMKKNIDIASKQQNPKDSSQEMKNFYKECKELTKSIAKKSNENKSKKRSNNVAEKSDEIVTKKCDDGTTKSSDESVTKKCDDNITKKSDESATKKSDDNITKNCDQNTTEKSTSDAITTNFDDLAIESVEQMPRTPRSNTVENKTIDNLQNIRVHFFCLKDKVVVIMRPRTQFTFLGKLKLKVLYGVVGLYGMVCDTENTAKPVEIYSPKGYGSITIYNTDIQKSSSPTEDKEYMWDILTSEGVDKTLITPLHEMLDECDTEWSVVMLENLENTLTKFLNVYFPFKLFPKIELVKYSWCDYRRAEFVLQSNLNLSESDDLSIGSFWNSEVQSKFMHEQTSHEQVCTMVTGGKGVGKSTTVRYLINSYLQKSDKVILLDLDPGQAEMTYPGCVSLSIIEEPLLGPNFTHLKHPYCQHYLDEVNVSNCIPRYIQYVKKLVDCLRNTKELSEYPIVVNTMGFCKGIGLDLCLFTIKLIQPTCVIQLTSKKPRNNYDYSLTSDCVNEVKTLSICWNDASVSEVLERSCSYYYCTLQSKAEGKRVFDTWNMEPRQQRELNMLSYFSKIVDEKYKKCYSSLISDTINNIVPYKVPFDSLRVTLYKSVPPTHTLAAINGNVVGLCGLDREQIDAHGGEDDHSCADYPQYVVNANPSMCYGFGIVRGVDMDERCLYINTPLSEDELQHVNLLLGCQETPLAFLRSLAMGSDRQAPYTGDRGTLPTSREARRGYFRVDLNASKKA